MTFPLSGFSPAGPAAAPAPDHRTALGRDQFLRLLVVQLRHQDPLSPMQPDAFAAQLAQFATVEQLTKLNEGFELQLSEQLKGSLLETTNLGASLLGRRVVAEGDLVTVTGGGPVDLRVDIGGAGGSATVEWLDDAGQVVASQAVGQRGPGMQTLTVSPGLAAGTYRYRVLVEDAAGRPVPVTTFIEDVVDGVLFENGAVILRLGGKRVPLENVTEITSSQETGQP